MKMMSRQLYEAIMNTDPSIFDFLLAPSDMFAFYTKIGTVLKNSRDITNERGRNKALSNSLLLLLGIAMIQENDGEYSKLVNYQTYELFCGALIVGIRESYPVEFSSVINCEKHYDETRNQFFIYVNDIPSMYMGLAMLLEQTYEFEKAGNKYYFLNIQEYEQEIAKYSKQKNRQMSLEQLKRKMEENEKAGELAELFVLDYENRRLGAPKDALVKRISEIDVTKGYDIVSFNSSQSVKEDRFIEVKAVSSEGFFWSRNEYNQAKDKGDKYYLYLVNLQRIEDQDYSPEMISNPAEKIMQSSDWFVEPESYHIRKILS